MQAFELTSMVAALALMFAAVGVKVVTAQLLARMRQQINMVAQMKGTAQGRLAMVRKRKQVVEKNKAVLLNKKTKLAKRVMRLRRELENIREEDEMRRQRLGERKVE